MTDENTQDQDKAITARGTLSPVIQAASIMAMQTEEEVCFTTLVQELQDHVRATHAGDMHHAESLLLTQAQTLSALFGNLMNRVATGKIPIEHFKAYFTLGLKCQNQCRMTLQTLAEIKNPRPYIQNNQAQYQQVNNAAPIPAREENLNTTNELLIEERIHEALDFGRTRETSGTDTTLETVGT